MKKLLVRWLILAASVLLTSFIAKAVHLGFEAHVDGVGSFLQLMVGVAVLAFANATLGRFLKVLTLPLTCMTFGLFSLVINAVVLILVAKLELGFRFRESGILSSLWAAIVASVLISVISTALNHLVTDGDDD